MNAPRNRPLLVDDVPSDPGAAMAARYMRSRLDEAIRDRDDAQHAGYPSEELRELLQLRYGAAVGKIKKEQGEQWRDSVARAFAANGRRAREDVDAYVVEWDAAAATAWFRGEVEQRWPKKKVGAPFLAADPVTLWSVCLALDLAPHRTAQFADDPFPAPPLLITGPTGIGKELLAKAIHECSGSAGRPPGPFGAINCGGLPPQLLESELFGHAKGAFTGAIKEKRGLVEEYKLGTLFLDEVGDMPPEVQVRMLRFLNDGEARRVGANQSYRAAPRIIAATHVDLVARAETGEFRRDLLHRLRGRHIALRGLADRPSTTVAPVVRQFLEFAASERGTAPPRLTSEVLAALACYRWPGNMRELKYVAERLFERGASVGLVEITALPDEIVASYLASTPAPVTDVLAVLAARERGEPHDHLQSRLKLVLGGRLAQHAKRTNTRAASLRQTASVVERIGRTFGIEQAFKPYCDVLHLAAQEAVADEFQKETLAQLETTAAEMQIDLEPALGTYKELSANLRVEARKRASRLEKGMQRSEGRYAATAVLAAAVRMAQQSDSKLVLSGIKFADDVLELAGSAQFAATARKLGERYGTMSPAEAKDALREAFKTGDDAEAPRHGEWRAIRDDRSALERLVKEAGSITEAAKLLKVRPETVSRTLRSVRKKSTRPSSRSRGRRS